MGKIYTKFLRLNGGIVNDPRTPGLYNRLVTGFDILTDPYRAKPYRDSESGDSSASTSKKFNFCVGDISGTPYLFGLGVVSGTAKAEVQRKAFTTGASDDLDDATWASPTANQSATGTTFFDCFQYYKRSGKIYGISGQYVWAFDAQGGGAWNDTEANLGATVTSTTQAIVHPQDNNFYLAYGGGTYTNAVARYNNSSWTVNAFVMPKSHYPTSITDYGNYLAIANAPLTGAEQSKVFLWDRDVTNALSSDNIDWGYGTLKVLGEISGYLLGISITGNSTTRFRNRIEFRAYGGAGGAKVIAVLEDDGSSTSLGLAKQIINDRLYFTMSITINGVLRQGVWSIGLVNGQWLLVHERTPNNDTALTSGQLGGFLFVGDYLFQSYISNSTYAVSKTNDQSSYTATSTIQTTKQNEGDSTLTKQLVRVKIIHEPLPSGGQIVLKRKKNAETTFSDTLITSSTANDISKSLVSITNPEYKEHEFSVESTGGAVPLGIYYEYEVLDKDI